MKVGSWEMYPYIKDRRNNGIKTRSSVRNESYRKIVLERMWFEKIKKITVIDQKSRNLYSWLNYFPLSP